MCLWSNRLLFVYKNSLYAVRIRMNNPTLLTKIINFDSFVSPGMLILRDHRRLCDIEWTTILILELVWHFPAVNMQTNPDEMQLHYRKDWYEQKTHRFTMQTILIKCVNIMGRIGMTWWRHQTETFSALLVICAGNSPVTDELPAQRPVTRSFDVFLDLSLNKRLSKQWWGWWFETPSCPWWHHCNEQRKDRFTPVLAYP